MLKLLVMSAVCMALAGGNHGQCTKDWVKFMVVHVCGYYKRSSLGEPNFAMLDEDEINRRFEQIIRPGIGPAEESGHRRLKKGHESRWKRSYEVNRPQKQLSGFEINREFAQMFQLQEVQGNSVGSREDSATTLRPSNFGPHRFKAIRPGNNLRAKRSPAELPGEKIKSAQAEFKSGSHSAPSAMNPTTQTGQSVLESMKSVQQDMHFIPGRQSGFGEMNPLNPPIESQGSPNQPANTFNINPDSNMGGSIGHLMPPAMFQAMMANLMKLLQNNSNRYGQQRASGQVSNIGVDSFIPLEHPYSEHLDKIHASLDQKNLEIPKLLSQMHSVNPFSVQHDNPFPWILGAEQPNVEFGHPKPVELGAAPGAAPGAAQKLSRVAGSGIFESTSGHGQGEGLSRDAPQNHGTREQRSLGNTEYAGDLLGLPMHYTDIEELVGSERNENSRRGVAKKIETCCSTICTVDDFKGLC